MEPSTGCLNNCACCLNGLWDCRRCFRRLMQSRRFHDLHTIYDSPSSSPISHSPSGLRSPMILKSDSVHFKCATPRSPSEFECNGEPDDVKHFYSRVQLLKDKHASPAKLKYDSCIVEDPLMLQLAMKLDELRLTGLWRIPRAAREVLEADLSLDTVGLLEHLTVIAQRLAVPVISVFHVGAVALGVSGDVYMGPNLEVCSGLYASNVCGFHYVVHAEVAAVLCAFCHGERELVKLYVSAMPCGHCRQFLAELPNFRGIEVWTPQMGRSMKLGELIPHAFGPADLGKSVSLLTSNEMNSVALASNSEAHHLQPSLAREVEMAAQTAYAPYTSSFAGAVLRLKDGRYCRGPCVESVAFNPSVTPLTVALVSLFASNGKVEDIVEACLAEDPSAPISYKGSDSALLSAVAPWVSLWLLPLTKKED